MKSLLKNWGRAGRYIKRYRYVLLLLDYDGTLTPIVRSPKRAFLAESSRRLLDLLNRNPSYIVSIVSGRSLEDVKRLVGLEGLIYIGNHGLELEGPKIHFINPKARETRALMGRLSKKLEEELGNIRGAYVENKGLSISVHFRRVGQRDRKRVNLIFDQVTRQYRLKRKMRITHGKSIFEVRPPVKWDKGKIVLWLLKRTVMIKGTKSIVPVYVGDDLTDEDAFRTLSGKGITVHVGRPDALSDATYNLANIREVRMLLRKLIDMK